jgi:hypothetical protein
MSGPGVGYVYPPRDFLYPPTRYPPHFYLP